MGLAMEKEKKKGEEETTARHSMNVLGQCSFGVDV
jgi:hypothetical protein